MTKPGLFISFEGIDGAGKSSHIDSLAQAFKAQGRTVTTTREPGGTTGAEAIRDLLMTGAEDRWSARAEALLFAAARADPSCGPRVLFALRCFSVFCLLAAS